MKSIMDKDTLSNTLTNNIIETFKIYFNALPNENMSIENIEEDNTPYKSNYRIIFKESTN